MRIVLFSAFILLSSIATAAMEPPKLIVQLVVDQLRGDLIQQHHKTFGENGFNFLLNHAINYQNAHHPHANTTTCAGHATIATGSYPYMHGMVANDWYDRHSNKSVYCVEDLNQKIIPTIRTRIPMPGRSPHNLAASTFSDELLLAQRGRAFSVSLKDRAAITLAGHAGKAFWFDKENGGFISSKAYFTTYPEWVDAWNKQYESKNITWNLKKPAHLYKYADAPVFKNRFPAFGDSFPHLSGDDKNSGYYKNLSMMPDADELTADFAIHMLKAEKLGQSPGKTDYLAISFSATDAIGHQFGPNSLESEDNLLRLDETLARLLKAIDAEVGLNNTLIILTADHGIADSVAWLAKNNMKDKVRPDPFMLAKIIRQGLRDLHLPENLLQAIHLPYIYLNHELATAPDMPVISARLAQILKQKGGIYNAFALPGPNSDWLSTKINNMAYPERAGDIYVVFPPLQSQEDGLVKINHGSPWRYDSYVPLLFVHPDFTPLKITRQVFITDIAASLAALLEIKAPSASVGDPLPEVMARYLQQ